MGGVASLIGRNEEFDLLQGMVAHARDGSGGVGLIEGEPGIGKTTLLAAVADDAARSGSAVVRGAAQALERDRPFAALADAFGLAPSAAHPRCAEIGELIYGGIGREASDARFLAVENITDLIEEQALSRPLLLVLEDLHWADPATLLVLHRLTATVAQLPIALIATLRPLPRSQQLHHVIEQFAAHGARSITLQPLSGRDVAAFVATRLGATAGPGLSKVLAGAAGNPLFLSEVLAALEQEELLVREHDLVDVSEASLPPSVTLTILRRMTYLSHDTLEMLRICSVLGTAFSLTDLARMMDRSVPELLPMIDEATQLGVLGEEEGAIAFRHDLIRDAIYDDMLTPVRTGLHHRAARTLIDAGAPAMRIAPHITLGAEPGDAEAVDWLRRTATRMKSLPHVAADLLDRAVEIAGSDLDIELRLRWVDALVEAGRGAQALSAAREAVAEDGSIRSRISLVTALGVAWRLQEGAEEAEAVAWDVAATPTQRAEMLAVAAGNRTYADRSRAEQQALEALKLARETGARRAEILATAALLTCAFRDGYVERAWRLWEENREAFTEVSLPAPYNLYSILSAAGNPYLALVGDRFDAARRGLDDARDVKNQGYSISAWYHWQRASLEMWSGRWDEAIAVGEAGLAVCGEGGLQFEASMTHEALCLIAIHRGDFDSADEHLRAMPTAMWTRALLAEAKGDTETLERTLDQYRQAVNDPSPWMMPTMVLVGPEWVRLYVEVGDPDSARILTEVVEEGARRMQTPTAEGAALRARGLLEGDPELLLKAVATHRLGPRPFLTAQACEDAGAALPPDPQRADEAIALLREALEVYVSVEASRNIARTEARLRARGVRRARGPRPGRPKFGWESLTDSERRVVALVPEGLSYREIGERLFISKRTVETHIAHAFAKLGISSRRELADEVRRQGR